MNPIYTAIVYLVWICATYFIVTFLLYAISFRKRLFESASFEASSKLPTVSIIVPAFNEEEHIAETIHSLKKIDYPARLLEIIVLNDGSSDRTAEIVSGFADGNHLLFVDNLKNKGKAACLNQGIALAKGEFVATMDSDSQVIPNILMKTLPQFRNPKVGAVTVAVEVNEKRNLLQKVIDLEFILGLSLFLKVFSFFNCIFVTPGPFSVYRRSMLKEIGGFDEHNITEDLEIAYRIHKVGYIIENTTQRKVITYCPATLQKLYVQRKRWYSGAILTLWQHKSIFFDSRAGLFRYFIPFNYSLIFLGIILLIYTSYIGISNLVKQIMLYSHTGFNFFSHLTFNFDPFSISIFSFFGVSATLLTVLFVMVGMSLSKKSLSKKITGFFGYLFIFFLYSFFWVASMVNVALRRKAKWR
jgi:cellulose synthase/poly-beta-1,6-N-acetylglucosamine synthase-like glycosyltransferase